MKMVFQTLAEQRKGPSCDVSDDGGDAGDGWIDDELRGPEDLQDLLGCYVHPEDLAGTFCSM